MANELHAETTSGLTLYAVLLNATGQVWNGAAWEAIVGANWATYDIAMTEAAAGIYLATMPSVAAGVYSYVVYSRAGASPAITDTLKGGGFMQWDGAAELALATIEAQTDDIGAAGAGLTALGDTRLANLDATVSSRSTFAPGTNEVETGITWTEWARALGAVLAGVLSGGGTTTVTFEAIGNTGTNRVRATVDANGNRSAITLTL